MKYGMAFVLLVCLVGCSQDKITTPTASVGSVTVPVVAGATRTKRDLNDPTASWSMSGPTGLDGLCLTPIDTKILPFDEFIWTLTVRDAGETGILRFKTMTFHDDQPGCLKTLANPRDRIKQPGGPASYPPHGSGSTTFAAPANEWNCGRSQFDIETEAGVLLVGLVVDYGTACTSEPPPHTPPTPTPTPVVCPDTNDLFIGEPRWTAVGDRVIVDFLLKPTLQNIQLSLASYKINTSPQDRLLGWTTGVYTGSGSMSITAANCSAQLDLLRCGPPLPVWPEGVEPASAWYNNPCAERGSGLL